MIIEGNPGSIAIINPAGRINRLNEITSGRDDRRNPSAAGTINRHNKRPAWTPNHPRSGKNRDPAKGQ